MSEKAAEPEYWTYELVGGPCDGHKGRSTGPRMAVHRPSTVDPGKIHIYHIGVVDGHQRFALYTYKYDGLAILATEADPDA